MACLACSWLRRCRRVWLRWQRRIRCVPIACGKVDGRFQVPQAFPQELCGRLVSYPVATGHQHPNCGIAVADPAHEIAARGRVNQGADCRVVQRTAKRGTVGPREGRITDQQPGQLLRVVVRKLIQIHRPHGQVGRRIVIADNVLQNLDQANVLLIQRPAVQHKWLVRIGLPALERVAEDGHIASADRISQKRRQASHVQASGDSRPKQRIPHRSVDPIRVALTVKTSTLLYHFRQRPGVAVFFALNAVLPFRSMVVRPLAVFRLSAAGEWILPRSGFTP